MRIGIITFFNGLNHGAFFQAYALKNTLEQLGHEVNVINYEKKQLTFNIIKVTLLTYRLRKFYNNLRKWINFSNELHHLNLTKRVTTHKQLNALPFDVVITGSDIVWHYDNKLYSFDSAYFCEHVNASRRIAYAASVGNLNYEQVPPRKEVVDAMQKYHRVSVRDYSSKKFAEQVLNTQVPIVADPTLLLSAYPMETPCAYKNFILVYAYHKFSKEEISYIRAFATKRNLQIINVGYTQNWCDVKLASIGPAAWLGFFKAADYVITSTFHGALFSIIYNKQFLIVGNHIIIPKLTFILESLALNDIYINDFSELESRFSIKISYAEVNNKLQQLRDHSINYLKEALA